MLTLSRREGQGIILNVPPSSTSRRIVVQIVRIAAGQVKVGTDAPREIEIVREELEDAICRK